MVRERSLFDDISSGHKSGQNTSRNKKEDAPLDRLKNLEGKITSAVEKVKALKEEKSSLESRIRKMESLLKEKEKEIQSLHEDKNSIKQQVEDLLGELDALEL
jgi:chromosome segregation ATPase